MSTNYYLRGPDVPADPDDPGLHIGKKSHGWDFLFEAHTSLGLVSVSAWRRVILDPANTVISEYGDTVDRHALLRLATRGSLEHERTHRDLAWRRGYLVDDREGVALLATEFC